MLFTDNDGGLHFIYSGL